MRYFIPAILVCTITSCLIALALLNPNNPPNHSCVSPCTVTFPNGTQEDDFIIDYGREHLQVWASTDTDK